MKCIPMRCSRGGRVTCSRGRWFAKMPTQSAAAARADSDGPRAPEPAGPPATKREHSGYSAILRRCCDLPCAMRSGQYAEPHCKITEKIKEAGN
jgi:hypothetical protein